MKATFYYKLIVALICLSNVGFGQVGDWPWNSGYVYFGAPQLPQANGGYYAVLQDKSIGSTFLNSNDQLHFRISNNDKMVLSNSGNLGIDVINPTSRLSVRVPVSTSNIAGNPNAYGAYFTDGSTSTLAIRSLGTGAFHLASDGGGRKIILGGGEFEQTLFVNTGGKVGIGLSASNASTVLSLGTPVQARMLSLHDSPSDWYGLGIQGGQMRFQVGSATARFSFFAGDNTEVMTIKGSGNIGIATTNPTEKLTVNGTIYGKEIKVDLNVPGPDYVFEKDYSLTPLDEVQAYIVQHKHLPEVPSAKEMERNGVKVGEMEMILLKKIEEMTLHLIEMKKQNDLQNERMQQMQAELDRIKSDTK